MTNMSAQKTWRSRLAVVVSLGLAVAGTACSEGLDSPMSPSGASPSGLAAKDPKPVQDDPGQNTRNFSVTMTPVSVSVGGATLQVTVTRNATSGQGQQVGSVEISVPAGLTPESVDHFSNPKWTGGVSDQTVWVGASVGNQKLDATTNSVTFDINVTSTECKTYSFDFDAAKASNETYDETFSANWTYTGSALSVEVTGCGLPEDAEYDAAPAVANHYLDSIGFKGKRGDIISKVAERMTKGAGFVSLEDVTIEKKDVVPYRDAVIAYVKTLLPPV